MEPICRLWWYFHTNYLMRKEEEKICNIRERLCWVSDSGNSGECCHEKIKVELMSKPKAHKLFNWEKRSKLKDRNLDGRGCKRLEGNFLKRVSLDFMKIASFKQEDSSFTLLENNLALNWKHWKQDINKQINREI